MEAYMSLDRQQIASLINDWAVFRDSGAWEKLRTVWHEDGRIHTTWFSGSADDFIRASIVSWNRGVSVLHFLGGTSIEVRGGTRAIAQTKMTISQRADVHCVLCDCSCTGRFYDFFEMKNGRWGLILRQPIYERDRIDPVRPGSNLSLDSAKLADFPEGYQHLAYVQASMGLPVARNLPGLRGARVDALYLLGERWLDGELFTAADLSQEIDAGG